MRDSADDIRQRMDHIRREVGDDVKGIVDTAKTLSDWRYHVKHHPWMCLGAAAALGFLVVPRRRHYNSAEARELIALLKKYNLGATAPQGSTSGLLRTLVGMAAPIAMRTAMNFAQNRFGGGFGSAFGSEPRESHYEDYNVPR